MQQSIQLLDRALQQQTISEWARTFNIVPSTITNARRVGRLSPSLAGNLAIKLGENPQQWIAIAAMEAEKDSTLKAALETALKNMQKL